MAHPISLLKGYGLLVLLPLLLVCGTAEVSSAQIILQKRTLTVTKSGYGPGSVTVDPGSLTWSGDTGTESYNWGTSVTLTASTSSSSSAWFKGWYGGGCTGPGTCTETNAYGNCIESTCTVSMSSSKSVTAYFYIPPTVTFTSFLAGSSAPAFGGAVITTPENYTTSLPDGSFLMIHDPGTFTMNVTAEGCSAYTTSVTVVELGTTTVPVVLSCTWATTLLSSTNQALESGSGTGSVTVTIPGSYSWTTASNASWITITAPTGVVTGNGTVSYSVAANGTGSPRTGTLTIAGQTYTVTQANPDTTTPKVTAVTAASPTSSLTIPVTITATDNRTGTIKYLVTAASTPPSAGAAGWTTTNPFSYIVASAGTYSLYGWAKDSAGNVSKQASPVRVVVDKTAPVTTASPVGGTFGVAQNVTLSANESATIYFTTNGNKPTESSSVYSTPIPIASTATLKYFAKDRAGNLESVKSQTYTIDTESPVGSVAVSGGITLTNGTSITLNISSTDAAQMKFSNDGTTWSSPEAYAATKSWTLPAGDGVKTIYVKFKDSTGNWSSAYTATVTLDTTPPITSASPPGGFYDSTQFITVSANEPSTIYYTTNGTPPSESSSVYSSPIPISATTKLRFFAKDTAGNPEAVKTEVYIQSVSMGDLNADLAVDLTDAVLALQVLCGLPSAQSVSDHAAVTMEGAVGLAEAIYILQKIAGLR
jgi:hypothetical protein